MAQPGTTSSQWVISRTGIAARVVPDNKQAWHAQEDNDNAWGIELEQGIEEDGFTEAQINKLVEVCRGYIEDFRILPVHVNNSLENGFIGHQETVQGKRNGKSDPGVFFMWDSFMKRLQQNVRVKSITRIGGNPPHLIINFEGNGTIEISEDDPWELEIVSESGEMVYEIKAPS